MRTSFKALAATALAFGALLASPAWAQSTWTYTNFTETTGAGSNAGTYGNTWSQTQNGVKLTVSAFSTTTEVTAGSQTGAQFATAQVADYLPTSGFGIYNRAEVGPLGAAPQHAVDNNLQTDMLALNFKSGSNEAKVVLTQLTAGWSQTDSDISLLRWTGAAAPTIVGKSIANLLTAGWTLVNNYADIGTTARNTLAPVDSASASSWWLISAYNSAWGTGSNTANLSNGNDYVKVLSSLTVTPTAGAVPEPGSVALVGAALFALAAVRRTAKSR